MKKFIDISKPLFAMAISLLFFCFILIAKILLAMVFGGGKDEESSDNEGFGNKSFYVIDEKGNEIIDDNVTMVFELDDQRNYKD